MSLKFKLFLTIGCMAFAFLQSCAPIEINADYFQKGFDYTQLGYSALPPGEPFDKTITLHNLRVLLSVDLANINPARSVIHILNFNDPDIVDPHDRATMEACIGVELESLCK